MDDQRPRTKRELDESRKLELRKLCTVYMDKWITSHPHMAEVSYTSISPNSSFTSIYTHNPKVKTKAELDSLRKLEAIRQNNANLTNKHLDLSERIEEREKLLYSHNSNTNNLNKNLLGKKTEDITRLESKFSSRPTGVHGAELPKFSEHLKDYWKIKDKYIEEPRVKTANSECRPINETYTSRPSTANKEITLKPNQINPFAKFEVNDDIKDIEKRPPSRPRFTQEFYINKSPGVSQENIGCAVIDRGKTTSSLRPRTGIAKNATPVKEFVNNSLRINHSIKENNSGKKERPRTAYILKISTTDNSMVRSRGFAEESKGNNYYL